MHLSLEELLAVRDGEVEPATVEHVAACASCAAELTALGELKTRLAALPVERPSRDLWPAVSEGARSERRARRLRLGGWVAAGLAAALTLAVGLQGTVEAWREARLARETRTLVAESQKLEQAIVEYGRGGRVVNGRTASLIADLEDRIALIDARIGQLNRDRPSQAAIDLWQERVGLLDALASVQTTRVAYVGL
jgi:hypothetical protein